MPQKIEPMVYKETKNIDEHRQIVDKLNNDVIPVLNNIGDVPPDVGGRLNTLEAKATANEDRSIANEQSIAGHTQDIADVMGGVANNEADILQLKDEAEAMANEAVDRLALNLKQSKDFSIDIVRGSGEVQTGAPLALPFVDTAVLIPGAGDFTFKIDFTMKDGSHVRTGDMVLPSGGVGPDVKISSVQIKQGTTADKFVVAIVLQDGTSIDSNEYTFPSVDAYDKSTSDDRYVRVAAVDQDIGGRKNFIISPYVPDLKPSEIVTGSKRAVNVGQVHDAFVNADNKSNGISERVTANTSAIAQNSEAINAISPVVEIVTGSSSDKDAIQVTVNGKSSKTDLPPKGMSREIIECSSYDEFMSHMTEYNIGDEIIVNSLSTNNYSFNVYGASAVCIDNENQYNIRPFAGYGIAYKGSGGGGGNSEAPVCGMRIVNQTNNKTFYIQYFKLSDNTRQEFDVGLCKKEGHLTEFKAKIIRYS